jgi:hypothetical protein
MSGKVGSPWEGVVSATEGQDQDEGDFNHGVKKLISIIKDLGGGVL